MTAPMSTADVLDRAADLIAEHGITRHQFHDVIGGGYCAIGAIQKVVFDRAFPFDVDLSRHESGQWSLYERACADLESMLGDLVMSWSDQHDAAEVVAVMHSIAARLRAARTEVQA